MGLLHWSKEEGYGYTPAQYWTSICRPGWVGEQCFSPFGKICFSPFHSFFFTFSYVTQQFWIFTFFSYGMKIDEMEPKDQKVKLPTQIP
jgi:hypothetical protein